MLPRITPIAPTRIQAAFDDPDFIWELKHDGFRTLAYIEDGVCRLISRKNIAYKSFATLCQGLGQLRVKTAILDGELVCLGNDGRSMFMDLMRRKRQDVILYAFDLVWLDGQDLRPLPLLDRKAPLRQVLKASKVPSVLYADHVQRIGTSFFKAICDRDCEGIVGKHKNGPYSTAPKSWVKVLNPDYTQKRGRLEMFDRFRQREDDPLRHSENPNRVRP
jgi:bifunctional non-homologous end joining protein LigD